MISIFRIAVGFCMLAEAATAAPRVVADIAPVHSLVAQVMEGVGEPVLLLPPSVSPHDYALRPSDAKALNGADAVFWIGHSLTPWLEKPLDALASDADVIELLEADGVDLLNQAAHGHDHDHDEHENDDAASDPHIWLDPENAKALVSAIADTLERIDGENADAYRQNEADALARLDALATEIEEALEPVRGVPFIVFHDAYGYFEARFDVNAAGALALGDGDRPGARRIAELRKTINEAHPRCAFAEPQFPERTIRMVLEDSDTRHGTLDPLGAGLEPGPDLYAALLRGMAAAMRDCLS